MINIFFVSFYFIFFLILRKVFLKSYKDILFIGSVLFLFQFQFYDIYNLSNILGTRTFFVATLIILIFFSLLIYKKLIIQDFISRFILIFNFIFIGVILYNSSVNYFGIKSIESLKEDEKKIKTEKIVKTGKNIYFIISDAAVDFKTFENKLSTSPRNKKILDNYKILFENKNFILLNNSINTNKTKDTAVTLGGLFNLKNNIDVNNKDYLRSYPVMMRFYEILPLAKKLKENHYNFYWSGNIWNNCNVYNENLCLVSNKKYSELLYSSRTIWNYLSSSYFGFKFKEYFLDEYFYKLIHDDLNLFDHLMTVTFPENKKQISEGNNFFFIHDWGPHPPYTYNNDCTFKSYSYDSIKGYENAYLCNIQKIYEFIDYLEKNDPNSIITVTSDHGYFDYRKNLFRMVKFGKCKFNENQLSSDFIYLFNKTLQCALN